MEELLNKTDLKVAVITGHMDLIVDTPGIFYFIPDIHLSISNYISFNLVSNIFYFFILFSLSMI